MSESPSGSASNSSGLAEVEWSIEPSKSGEPTLRIARRHAHSAYSPHREAAGMAEKLLAEIRAQGAQVLIALGSGLGYVYTELLEQIDIPILLWEPFPELASQVLGDDARWREKVRIVTNPKEYELALAEYRHEARHPYFFVHPSYEHPARFEVRYLALGIRALQKGDATHRERDWIVSPRSLDFLCRYPFVHLADELRSRFEGQTAVIVAGGPSLHLAKGPLQKRRGGVLLAALQAVIPLRQSDVEIDFGVISDPKNYSRFIEGCTDPYAALLADSSSDPIILDRAPDTTYIYHIRTPHLHESAWVADGNPIIDVPTVTVSEVSVLLAFALGVRRMVLAGVDFASTDERYGVRFQVPGADGAPTWTNSAYFQGARCMNWLCPQIEAEGCQIYRLGDGLPLRGTQRIDASRLEALLDDSPPFDAPEPATVYNRDRFSRADALLARAHKKKTRPLKSEKSVPLADFESLSGSALRRACVDARNRLGRSRPTP